MYMILIYTGGLKMFKKVLVPTDFSRYAQKVLGCLGGLPGLKEVVLLNILTRNPAVEIWDPVTLVSDAEKKVLNEGRHIKIPGIAVKPRAIINSETEIFLSCAISFLSLWKGRPSRAIAGGYFLKSLFQQTSQSRPRLQSPSFKVYRDSER